MGFNSLIVVPKMKSSNIAYMAKLIPVKERQPANGMLLTETK